jgi:hypothetical protein
MHSAFADGYHYIRGGDGKEELYHFLSDPLETRDLAGTPEGMTRIARMRALAGVDAEGGR